MASTGDTKATTNGPGTISEALTAFEARRKDCRLDLPRILTSRSPTRSAGPSLTL